jgi:hypothetical protein
MTLPAPTQPAPPAAGHAVPLLTRWRLTEPVRLYLYLVLLVLTAGLQTAGALTGEWAEFTAINGALLLGVGAAGEAARASVYSTASAVREIRRAAGSR